MPKTRVFKEVIDLVDGRIVEPSTIEVAAQAMPIAAPLSTILTLAGLRLIWRIRFGAFDSGKLGVRSLLN